MFVGVVNILSRIVILDNLVLDKTHAGLLDRHLGERDAGLVCCGSGRLEDPVDLLL